MKNVFMHTTSPRLYLFLLRILELLRCTKPSPFPTPTCLFTLRNCHGSLEDRAPSFSSE